MEDFEILDISESLWEFDDKGSCGMSEGLETYFRQSNFSDDFEISYIAESYKGSCGVWKGLELYFWGTNISEYFDISDISESFVGV